MSFITDLASPVLLTEESAVDSASFAGDLSGGSFLGDLMDVSKGGFDGESFAEGDFLAVAELWVFFGGECVPIPVAFMAHFKGELHWMTATTPGLVPEVLPG